MIINALSISLIVLFMHFCSWEGEIFEGIKTLIKPEGKLYKPIYGCPVCMTSYWGSLIYWLFFHRDFIDYILTIGIASGFAVIYVVMIGVKDILKKINQTNAVNKDKQEDK